MDEFGDLKKKLSRLTLEDRISMSGFFSFVSIGAISKFKRNSGLPNIWPWEAETFATIALTICRQSSIRKKAFERESFSYFRDAQSLLEEKALPKNYKSQVERFGIDGLVGPIFMQQIAVQQNTMIATYRYYRLFFEDEWIRKRFAEKTNGGDYSFFVVLANLVPAIKAALEEEGLPLEQQYRKFEAIMELITNEKKSYLKTLSVSIDELRTLQEEKASLDIVSDTYYSYKVLNEKPFLQVNERFCLVCPSSLPYACTDALYISMTYHDKCFKQRLTKFVFEDYVNELARETGLYQMVPKERQRATYIKQKNQVEPVDAVLMRDGILVFLELKARTYIRKSWRFDEETIHIEINHTIDWIKQMLDRFRDFRDGYYKPFGDTQPAVNKCFLVLGTLLYLPLDRSLLIRKVVEDPKYEEFEDFLKTSFVRTDIYNLETYWLYKKDPIEKWLELASQDRLRDFGPKIGPLYAHERLASFSAFHKLVAKETEKVCDLEFNNNSSFDET